MSGPRHNKTLCMGNDGSMKTSVNADGGYEKARASGKEGWSDEADYDSFKRDILDSFSRSDAPKAGRLLEIGCGAGNITLWLSEMGYEAYGVDTTPKAIEWAQDRNERSKAKADFRLEDAGDLNTFSDGYFDIVVDGRCLHWIYGPGRLKILQAVRRVLKADGFLLVSSQCNSPGGQPPTIDSQLTYDASRQVVVNSSGDICAYFGTPDSIIAEIKDAGFRVLNSGVITEGNSEMVHIEALKNA